MTDEEIRRLGQLLDEKLSGLDQRFDKVDQQFEKVDQRFNKVDQRFDDLHRHFDTVAENLVGQIQQVAEGVVLANERLDRVESGLDLFEQHTTAEFGEVKSMIRLSYAELERRLGTLESTVLDLAHRVEALERQSSQ